MITIDGSIGEGGGQILRYSLALASVIGKPVRIINIRVKRKNPGLQPQHLTSVRAVSMMTDAEVEGAYRDSTELIFKPKSLKGGSYVFDVGTAGSVTLVLQSILPILPLLDSETHIEIRGGTDVPMSPPIDYVKYILLPLLKLFGCEIDVTLVRRGHYPKGGGIVKIISRPVRSLKPIDLIERGKIFRIGGRSHCVRLPSHVAERQAKAAEEFLENKGIDVPMNIELEHYEPNKDPHLGPGSGIVLYAVFEKSVLGSDSLGAKGKPAEAVGKEAAEKLYEEIRSNATVDKHAGDMILPLAVLAKGTTRYIVSRLTSHILTAIDIIKLVLDINVSVRPYGNNYLLEIPGIQI
ncbi:MAG: RNA 3'-terminal phosphate cyclase [Ignisphaera sp.]|uniref:RNA 3'-terminal phosphate cyclase n=1 Tax=Ignisphaera aggregans TaxID=334771 RepID=A0A7J3N094_9CREN